MPTSAGGSWLRTARRTGGAACSTWMTSRAWPGGPRGGGRCAPRLAPVVPAVPQLRPDGPAYRGVPAVELAGRASFEEVAELLMASGPLEWSPVAPGAAPGL